MPAMNPMDALNIFEIFRMFGKNMTKEERLEQQKSHPWFPTLDDEAVLAALDAKVEELSPGSVRFLTLVRQALTPQERERWRKIIASIDLTEKHIDFMTRHKVNRRTYEDDDDRQPDQSQRRRQNRSGRHLKEELNEEKDFERKKRDYEYTREDPRIEHYLYVAGIVRSEIPPAQTGKKISAARIRKGEERGVAKATEYLKTDFFVDEQLWEKFLKDANAFAKNTLNAAGHIVYRLHLGSEYERIMGSTEPDERKLILLTEALRKKTKRVRDEIAANKKGLRGLFSNPIIAGGAVFAVILLYGVVVSIMSLAF